MFLDSTHTDARPQPAIITPLVFHRQRGEHPQRAYIDVCHLLAWLESSCGECGRVVAEMVLGEFMPALRYEQQVKPVTKWSGEKAEHHRHDTC